MKPSILLAVLLCVGCFDTAKAETASDLPPAYKLQTDGSQWRWILIRGLKNGDDFVTWATYESREACANAAWNHYKFVAQPERVWHDEETARSREIVVVIITNTVVVTNACPDQQPRWMLPAPMPHGWFNMTNSGPLILPYTIPTNWFDRTNNTINCQVGNVEAQ